jgi:DNA-binding transcriptional ArsR family regulator
MGTDAAEILLHPVRMRIVLTLAGRRLTSAEIAQHLEDVPQASLYRHIRTLADHGVLAVVEQRPVRGTQERVYVLAEGAASLTPEDLAKATREDHLRYFTIFLATLLGDFGRYLQQPRPDLLADGVGYRQVPLELTDQEFAELAGRLNAAVAPAIGNQPGPGRRRRVLTTIVMPTEPEKDRS